MNSPDPDQAAKHTLDQVENQRIFAEQIIPARLSSASPRERPVVVFLIGQQGAGKSRTGAAVADQLADRGGYVEIDTDLYKPFHPDYDTLLAEADTLMALYTGTDGRAWMFQAHRHAREHRLNAIVHETAQDADYTAASMSEYRHARYRVEVLILGVPEAMSRQGIVHRYVEQVRDRGSGRLTDENKATASYNGILQLADHIDRGQLADQVAVYRRGLGEAAYSNVLAPSGQWKASPQLRQAIEVERHRPWSATETAQYLEVQQSVL